MLSGIPALNHEEQQEAVERIHQLMDARDVLVRK
ncbi:YoaH family protein [Providencia vermicola]|nr:YoaH family protein [Providencia sp. G1(2023)]MBC8653474.1 YoaH family protein [Providencia vermicola]